jgi:hypothetical protein
VEGSAAEDPRTAAPAAVEGPTVPRAEHWRGHPGDGIRTGEIHRHRSLDASLEGRSSGSFIEHIYAKIKKIEEVFEHIPTQLIMELVRAFPTFGNILPLLLVPQQY